MRRRRVIGAAAGVVTVGGCLGLAEQDPDTTDHPDTTDEPEPDTELTVSDVTVTPELVALNSPDSIGTYGGRTNQYLVASVAVEQPPAPDLDDFALAAGGETYDPLSGWPGRSIDLWNFGEMYEGDRGLVGFDLPKPLSGSDPAITWPGGEYALGEDAAETLAREPAEFAIREFDAPESAEDASDVPVSLTVENVGDADGTFVAALNRVGPMIAYVPEKKISLGIPAGETATWEYVHSLNRVGGDIEGPEMRLRLNWRGGSDSRTVEIHT